MTANLYVPTLGKGPWPGVLVLCGHSDKSKAYDAYQRACILLVKNGFVVLIVDPVGQGERNQFLNASGQIARINGKLIWSLHYEHTAIDSGARLVGRSTVAYEVWDNIRGIDYLLGRPEVDNEKPIGCTGNSGGGTQTTFLMAVDDRIGPAAPSCFIKTREGLFKGGEMTDACQQLAGEGAVGIEEADFISMRAPKPTLILAATGDYFRIADTRTTFNEAKRVYKAMGFPERVDMFEYRDRHGFSRPRRQAAVRWMRRWLYDDNRPVVEPELKVQSEQDLWVTKNGQADSFWKSAVNVRDLNIQRAKVLAAGRKDFWKRNSRAKCLQEVKRLIGYRELTQKPTVKRVSTVARNGYRIEKCIIERTGEVPLAALLFVPDEADKKLPATLYVDGRGKHSDAREQGPLAKLTKQGRIVLSVDLRGFGETAPRQSAKLTSEMLNDQYINGMLAMYIGRPLLGQRVEDLLTALNVLRARGDVNGDAVDLVGVGRAGPIALHAAALEPRFSAVTVRDSIGSWINGVVAKPLEPNLIDHVVPSALMRYDLPDLKRALADKLNVERRS